VAIHAVNISKPAIDSARSNFSLVISATKTKLTALALSAARTLRCRSGQGWCFASGFLFLSLWQHFSKLGAVEQVRIGWKIFLKEQDSKIQKVNALLELSKGAPQTVPNSH